MERIPVCLIAAFCTGLSHPAIAQLGANWFSKPAISEAVNPIVGKGGQYQTTRPNQKDATPELQEFAVVGRESVDGKDGFWVEISRQGKGDSGMVYAKILFTKDDFQFHKIVVQQPGQQAIAMPFQPSDKTKTHMSEEAEKWHAVGAESITVPAGTFSCKHWKKDNSAGDTGDSDIWTSEKISPFGIVKQATPAQTMVLVKVITDAQDHITGPVKTFDPDEMKRQMMEKMQQQRPQKP
jgi:hypothetical protein